MIRIDTNLLVPGDGGFWEALRGTVDDVPGVEDVLIGGDHWLGRWNWNQRIVFFSFQNNVYFCRGSYKKNTVFIQLQHEFYSKPGSYNKTGWRYILHQILQS